MLESEHSTLAACWYAYLIYLSGSNLATGVPVRLCRILHSLAFEPYPIIITTYRS